MIRYCYRRILLAIPVMIGISLLAFILGLLSPGDPAEFALNQDGLDAPTDAQIAAMREELGLNRPIYVQYFSWFVQVLHGNLGSSYISGKDILHELLLRLPVTVELALLALAIAAVVGIALGTLCAVYKNSWLDDAVQFLTNILLAVPGFWLALLMILLFSETLRLLPTSGSESLRYFIMPALAVSFSTLATVCRYMRSLLLTEFASQYFLVARVRGISKIKLLFCYAAGNCFAGQLSGRHFGRFGYCGKYFCFAGHQQHGLGSDSLPRLPCIAGLCAFYRLAFGIDNLSG